MQFQSNRSYTRSTWALTFALCALINTPPASAANSPGSEASDASTLTPVKHLVVIFQENRSFDHYFGTYPQALNLAGETPFHALRGTPSVNGLNSALLSPNPNSAQPRVCRPPRRIPAATPMTTPTSRTPSTAA
jgi:phospholipase C